MWHVYILLCKNDSLYTGIAKDVEKRFKDHLAGKARYTSYNPPLKILFREKYRTRSKAQKREAQIKKLSRKEKLDLIALAKASTKKS